MKLTRDFKAATIVLDGDHHMFTVESTTDVLLLKSDPDPLILGEASVQQTETTTHLWPANGAPQRQQHQDRPFLHLPSGEQVESGGIGEGIRADRCAEWGPFRAKLRHERHFLGYTKSVKTDHVMRVPRVPFRLGDHASRLSQTPSTASKKTK